MRCFDFCYDDQNCKILHFGLCVYKMASIVIFCPFVSPPLNISETTLQFFLRFSMKLGHHKCTQVTEPREVSQTGDTPHFGGILVFFYLYLCIQSFKMFWNCMKLGHHYGTKVSEPWNFIYVTSLTLSNTSRELHAQ